MTDTLESCINCDHFFNESIESFVDNERDDIGAVIPLRNDTGEIT